MAETHAMISYAQNHEDVLLNRVFRDEPQGFYIDVGAAHPQVDSVTRHFYEHGWHGINIEPRSDMFALLVRQRSRDLNLNVGISNEPGTLRFFQVEVPEIVVGDAGGLSTFDAEQAEQYRREGRKVREQSTPAKTLTDICEEHDVKEISFLKIDVEGHEKRVIEGLDWQRFRPRVVVVEATLPESGIPCHAEWEPLLLEADYLFAAFDGLNRYYVRKEDTQLLEHFQAPVNVLDNYVPHEIARIRRVAKTFAWIPRLLKKTGVLTLMTRIRQVFQRSAG